MEMNNDIFTPDLPIPEPVDSEDIPIPAPAKDQTPAETPPPRRRHRVDATVLTIESGDEIETEDAAKPPRGMRFTTLTARGAFSPCRWAASSRPTAARRLQLWTTMASASSSRSKK